jgi:hypothetical protein
MLQFQESEMYRAALGLNGIVRDLDGDAMLFDAGNVTEMLRQRVVSMLMQVARAANEGRYTRLEALDKVRGSAFVCAALFDICRHRSSLAAARYDEARELLERIVRNIEAESQEEETLLRDPR